jgi:hypothetical protein
MRLFAALAGPNKTSVSRIMPIVLGAMGFATAQPILRPTRHPRPLADLLNSSRGPIIILDSHFFDDTRNVV